MATLTQIGRSRDVAGVRRRFIGIYTGPASYETGGEAISPGDFGMGTIESLDFSPAVDSTPVVNYVVYNHTTGKAVWFVGSSAAQVGNGQNMSTFSCRFEATGY